MTPHPDKAHSSLFFLHADGIGNAQIAMPDHAENMGESPIDGDFHHLARNRVFFDEGFNGDVNAIGAGFHRKGFNGVMKTGRRIAIDC